MSNIISIHAPREGCDAPNPRYIGVTPGFQSTHPVRDATYAKVYNDWFRDISIHAPREGCDGYLFDRAFVLRYFNPRTP